MRAKQGEPVVRIHPKTASEHQIADGDKVVLISPYGRIHLQAKLSEVLDKKVVNADYGWWFPERGEDHLFSWEVSNINILTSGNPPYDPVLGTTPLRNIPCRIEKIH